MVNHWKRILSLAWPLIVANSFWTLQMTIDRIFLGQYSLEALGASMAVMGVFWTPMALLQQTASYVTTFVAQYLGSKKKDFIGISLWQGIYFSFIGGIAFLFLNFLSEDFFVMVGHEPEVQRLEILYYNAVAFSALPMALVAAFSGFFTGLERTQIVMIINGIGLVLNVVFDYLLIFGNMGFPELGVEGAGYATTLAGYGSAVFAAIVVFTKANEEEFKVRSSWRWHADTMKRFIRYGVPSGMQWALEGLAFTVFLIFIGRFENGAAALAASSIAVTTMMLAILPPMGVAQSVMALVGQHIGEKKPEKAIRDTYAGVQVSAVYIVVLASSFVLLPEFYTMWFANDQDPALWLQVEEIAKNLLIFVAAFTLFDSINFNVSFALKGAGDTRYVSLVALILPWPLFVIPTYFLPSGQNAVYYAWCFVTAYIIILALVFFARFRGGKWKSMSVLR